MLNYHYFMGIGRWLDRAEGGASTGILTMTFYHLGASPKNADFPLLKVEQPCCDVAEGARSKGKQ